MKVQASRNEVLEALQAVIGVVERRQTLPVLSNILLEAHEAELIVSGTDMEMELVARARVQNLEPGKVTVPARKLFDICRGLPEGADLVLEGNADKVVLRSARSRFSLASLPAAEFPTLAGVEHTAKIGLTRSQLKGLLEKTMFAMAQQDVRYYLNGLLLEIGPHRVRTVATDGHRLALSEVKLETGVEATHQVILPRKSVIELNRLLTPGEEIVSVSLGQGQVQVELDVVRMTTKVIDGRFPDYERVIPEGGDKRLEAGRETLRKALARAAVLSNEKFRGVRLQLEPGRLKLQTHNPEHEEAEEELDLPYAGGEIEIGFNVSYLLDALAVVESEQVIIELKNADSSGLVYGSEDQTSRYVIMPMRL